MSRAINLTGQTFGRLAVISRKPSNNRNAKWLCLCTCGKYIITNGYALRSGHTQSCGCLNREIVKNRCTTHGQYGTRTYKSWSEMRNRCNNSKDRVYKYYGSRGITICSRWENFESFFADMGLRPKNKSLERIDNNGNYEPLNCKWATAKEQARNTRANRIIIYGKKTQCLVAWAEELNIKYNTLWARLNKYPAQVAFNM